MKKMNVLVLVVTGMLLTYCTSQNKSATTQGNSGSDSLPAPFATESTISSALISEP